MKSLVAAGILLAVTGASGCTPTSAGPAPDPTVCAAGEGHWIEDDNGVTEWLDPDATKVTVRLCLSDTGKILDLEVD